MPQLERGESTRTRRTSVSLRFTWLPSKGSLWFHCCVARFAYGMGCHIGVESGLGLVHSVVSMATNVRAQRGISVF